tara:strand:- start:83 stop:1177 length:1095 start_codon:yes stop_codon:yes gene_type:complete
MSIDLGWGREIFALAIAIQNIIWGLGQPVAGMFADRFGTARVLVIGGLFYALGIIGMAYSPSPFMFHVTGGLLVGLGLSGVSFPLVLAALSRIVPEQHRNLTFGICTAMGSIGQFLLVPMGQAFLNSYHWSVVLILLALLVALVVPLSIFMRGRPEETIISSKQSMGEALREAANHSGYVYLTLGFFVCGFHITFVATHLPAYITDQGLSAEVGAWSLSVIGLFNVFGAICAGILANKFQKKNLLSAIYLSRGLFMLLFVLTPISETTILILSAGLGLSWLSTVPLTTGIVAQVFGPRFMATLFGFVLFSHQLGAFLGVWLGGKIFDETGSYTMVWWLSIALALFAALVHLPINERPLARLKAI